MAKFIPNDPAKAEALNAKLGQTMFKSVQDFVNFYNSGLINKKHKDVLSIVGELTATFKDVKERNNSIVFISHNEIVIDELSRKLHHWNVVAKVKRDLDQLLSEGTITQNSAIRFSNEAVGFVQAKDENGDWVRVGHEKLFPRTEDVESLYEKYSTNEEDADPVEAVFSFHAGDLLSIDDDFILQISELVPND